MTEFNTATYQDWLGKEVIKEDVISAWPAQALAATLDRQGLNPQPGDELPPAWHWLYFLSHPRRSELGVDGHAAKGGFLPPIPIPRRMWAGGCLEFDAPLRIGDAARRRSRVADLQFKKGRSGNLAFVTVQHDIGGGDGGHIGERQDIVYRESAAPNARPPAPRPAPAEAEWSRTIDPSPILLFRYSALTFNGHRIHYDRAYSMEQEGYPGLVVHAPLNATLMLDLVREKLPDNRIKRFAYRAVSPIIDPHPYTINAARYGNGALVWVLNHLGQLAVSGEVELV